MANAGKALLPLPPRQRNDVRLYLMGVLDWAAANKWTAFGADGNPARFEGVRAMLWPKPPKRKDQKQMVRLPWAELPDFYKALANAEAGNALRFLILTGSRTKELVQATWGEIEGDNGTSGWAIPAENTKTDNDKFVPLVPQALPAFAISLTHSRARGAHDGGCRRRNASYGVARDSNTVSTIR
jgi:integrase